MKQLYDLFIIFFKIGTFTIGGGYAMIPLIEKEVVDKKEWLTKEDFLDMLALAQSAPGPIAVDVAVFVGYRVAGVLGSIFAVLGAVLTAFAILLVIAMYFVGVQDNVIVERIFKGLRPAVVALIASPVIRLSKSAKINKKTVIIPILTVVLVAFFNVNPVYIIIGSAIIGIMFCKLFKREKSKE